MSAFLDILIKSLIPVIPTLWGLAWTKSRLLDKLETDSKVAREQIDHVTTQVDLMRKDIYRLQIQNDSHESKLLLVSGAVLKANTKLDLVADNSGKVEMISDEQKGLLESYGKIIVILDKLIKKSKNGSVT